MSGLLVLRQKKPYDEIYNYSFDGYGEPYGYYISIATDLTDSFEDLISQPGDFAESVNLFLEFCCEVEDALNTINLCKSYKGKEVELIQNAEYVKLEFSVDEIAQYIQKNPILKTKKIVFGDMLDVDSKFVSKIKNAFGTETSNLYFDVDGNFKLVNFQEYCDTVRIIDDMVQEIEKFNYSPLEKIMYVYDLVRRRIYSDVDSGEDEFLSRDLTSVLLGDKIVCVGYARIFKTLLRRLGIDAHEFQLSYSGENSGHARNEVYVKDEKYGVDAVYYFDPTWDSKKEDDSYLLSYKYFAMTKRKMDYYDNGQFVNSDFFYRPTDVLRKTKLIAVKRNFMGLSGQMINCINHMSKLIDNKKLIKFEELYSIFPNEFRANKIQIIKEMKTLVEKFDKPLSSYTLYKVLSEVRKNPYYSDNHKYPLTTKYTLKVFMKSDWDFENKTGDYKLLKEAQPKQLVKKAVFK